MHHAMTHRILEKRSRSADTAGVKIRRAAILQRSLKVLFFNLIFSRAVRVHDRVFAHLRFAETGYTKYTVLVCSLAYDVCTHVPSGVKA